MAAALAAGLVAMAARFSTEQLPEAAELAAAADQLRARATGLAGRDAAAYQAVLDAYALPRDGGTGPRRERIRAALQGAAVVPLEIAETAAQAAGLAVCVATGNRNLRGDILTAVHLAEAAARSAAALVDINAELGGLPAGLPRRATEAVAAAAAAREQVTTVD